AAAAGGASLGARTDEGSGRKQDTTRPLRKRAVTRVRPGHADLSGLLKYDRADARDILERASARETTARVAAAAVCKRLLAEFGGGLAGGLLSIPAVKAVEIGLGFEASRRTGAEVHDEIEPSPNRPLTGNVRRRSNRAGGLEGGITTGEPLVLHIGMKPISTLMRPLATIDVHTGQPAAAVAERSDITAVPAMGVIAEGMAALVLAEAF